MANKRITELDPAGALTGDELIEIVQETGNGLDNVRTPLLAVVEQLGQQGPQGEQGPQGPVGSEGPQGLPGVPGADGDDGWAPVVSVVNDGNRCVLQVASWTGGTGTPPPSGKYVGAVGLVDLVADGIDIRGTAGAQGDAGPAGPVGVAGAGVPAGGATGQILAKTSDIDLDTRWIDPPSGANAPRTINTQTASYALQLSDAGGIVEMNVAGANNLTVPDNATVALPIGAQTDIAQYGAGQTAIVPGAGVTVVSISGNRKIAARYGTATLYKRAANEWLLTGNLVA